MKIAIIDADLVSKRVHRFPNLACMKLSAYYKELGHDVELKLDYNNLELYDSVKISKVYTDTPTPAWVLELPNVEYGGTGFFFDKAPDLPDEIEHHRPDYTLYIDWANKEIARGIHPLQFDDFFNASVGFLTRGCFRRCTFCVNRKYDRCLLHSPLSEFLDTSRRFIALADDNFLSYPFWEKLFDELEKTKKPFIFTQGLDIRLLTEHTAERFSKVRYRGDFIFAFDHLEDRDLIESKLTIWRKYISKRTKLYVFSGFDYNDKYDEEFWARDIASVFERAKILMKYNTTPYIMRFFKYNESPYRGMYITLCRWCNQPAMFRKKSFRQFCVDQLNDEGRKDAHRYMSEFETNHPDVAAKYFDMRFSDVNEYVAQNPKGYGPKPKPYVKA